MLRESTTPISGKRSKTWWSRLSWVQSPVWPVFTTTMLPADIPVLNSSGSTSSWTPSWNPGCWRWTSLPVSTAPAHSTWMWKVPWLLSSSTWPGLYFEWWMLPSGLGYLIMFRLKISHSQQTETEGANWGGSQDGLQQHHPALFWPAALHQRNLQSWEEQTWVVPPEIPQLRLHNSSRG